VIIIIGSEIDSNDDYEYEKDIDGKCLFDMMIYMDACE
jgi:hypothetical protein